MLILERSTRFDDQKTIRISDDIKVHILGINSNQVRLGIEAPKEMTILRDDAKSRPADSNR